VIGTHTELIFVDGASTDGTPGLVEEQMARYPEKDIRLLHQIGGGGKAAAVFQGFDAASGDIVMILDADMAVAPEDLPRFFDLIASGRADFGNGTRFLYAMESGAMRALNNVGNRLFCAYLSWLVGARITDTLCGTKSMRRSDWYRIREVRPRFGGHDPWGDFDLLLGAASVGLRIRDVPVVYRARTAGESKMHAFSHGTALAMTCLAGLRALKLQRGLRRPG
jgi:glycosyltransferase involved in cell wall biosynthesis